MSRLQCAARSLTSDPMVVRTLSSTLLTTMAIKLELTSDTIEMWMDNQLLLFSISEKSVNKKERNFVVFSKKICICFNHIILCLDK